MEQYFVSYTVQDLSGYAYKHKKYRVLSTNDLAEILEIIIPHRRRIGKWKLSQYLQEYDEHGHINLGTPAHWWCIRDIEVQDLPEQDRMVLDRYLWPGQFTR